MCCYLVPPLSRGCPRTVCRGPEVQTFANFRSSLHIVDDLPRGVTDPHISRCMNPFGWSGSGMWRTCCRTRPCLPRRDGIECRHRTDPAFVRHVLVTDGDPHRPIRDQVSGTGPVNRNAVCLVACVARPSHITNPLSEAADGPCAHRQSEIRRSRYSIAPESECVSRSMTVQPFGAR